jgi:hypothetical protein
MNHSIKSISLALEHNDYVEAKYKLSQHVGSIDDIKVKHEPSAKFISDYIKENRPDFGIKKSALIKSLSKYLPAKEVKELLRYSNDNSKPEAKLDSKSLDCYLDNISNKYFDNDHKCLKKVLGDHDKIPGYGNTVSILKAYTKCESGVNCTALKDSFSALYNKSPIVAKIMEAGAKACKKDNCKIVFTYDKHYSNKFDDPQDIITNGYYNGRSDMFIAGNREDHSAIGVFLHELTHYVMAKVYNNDSNPYPSNEQKKIMWVIPKKQKEYVSDQDEYTKVMQALENLGKFKSPNNGDQRNVQHIVNHLKDWYKVDQLDKEMVVRYPHLVGESYDKLDINYYLEPLETYLQTAIIPDINAYLEA